LFHAADLHRGQASQGLHQVPGRGRVVIVPALILAALTPVSTPEAPAETAATAGGIHQLSEDELRGIAGVGRERGGAFPGEIPELALEGVGGGQDAQ
jgi:hypothetical protein